eukprot:gene26912-4434_t
MPERTESRPVTIAARDGEQTWKADTSHHHHGAIATTRQCDRQVCVAEMRAEGGCSAAAPAPPRAHSRRTTRSGGQCGMYGVWRITIAATRRPTRWATRPVLLAIGRARRVAYE